MRIENTPLSWLLSMVALLFVAITPLAAQESSRSQAQATVPLDEVLRLYRENEAGQQARPAKPPVAAAVQHIEIQGRLLDDAVALDAHFEVAVLADGTWTELPLLRPDEDLSIPSLPAIENATLLSEGGALSLATQRRGRYTFDVTLIKRARVERDRRTATLLLHAAAPTVLRLRHDGALFEVLGKGLQREADGVVVHPRGAELAMSWKRLVPIERVARSAPQVPIEPVVTAATASMVSTLAGRPITRVHFALRFSGKPTISLQVPAGQQVDKVFVNGVGVPFVVEDGAVRLIVAHARAGDESASLELVLLGEASGYNLSGRLHHAFPSASWTVNEYFVVVHLPAVFNYAWSGGSLAPVDSVPAVEFTDRIPEPGKQVLVHQFLVAGSTPSVDIDYTIDLEGQYFTAR
ncbi:MAG: hypothetical protein ABIJ09_06195 [Pseudomonadota bacterium]